jgi:hypothetical protein
MAISTINVGSSANKGDGDPLRTAFTKINDNFTDVNTRLVALEDGSISTSVIGDLKGSVFADDSTLLVDAVNGVIPGYVKVADLKTALNDGAGDYAAFKAWALANL